MAYVAANPDNYAGQVVGDGQCVTYVKAATMAPQTSLWIEGQRVKGSNVAFGTAIATFQGGHYTNNTTGQSHAAIYISQDATGILVWDQWVGQPVHQRVIRFQGGAVAPRNDGDAFCVID
jgi:hypothetical protein